MCSENENFFFLIYFFFLLMWLMFFWCGNGTWAAPSPQITLERVRFCCLSKSQGVSSQSCALAVLQLMPGSASICNRGASGNGCGRRPQAFVFVAGYSWNQIIEWLGLGETSRIIKFQPPCHKQGCQLLGQVLDQITPGPIQPDLKYL